MHEASSNTVPSVIHVPGHLLVSYSLPVGGSAQFSWTSVPEDKQNDTIGKPDSSQEIPAMIEAGAGPPMRISSATPQGSKILYIHVHVCISHRKARAAHIIIYIYTLHASCSAHRNSIRMLVDDLYLYDIKVGCRSA